MQKVLSFFLWMAGLFAGLVGAAIATAFIVYVHPWAPGVLSLFCALHVGVTGCLLVGIGLGIVGMFNDRTVIWIVLGAVAALMMVLLLDNYMLYLATTWGTDLSPFQAGSLGFLQAGVNFIGGFFANLFEAVTGIEVKFPSAALPSTQALSESVSPTVGPMLQWALDSFWNIVLGIVSGALCGVMIKARN